MTDEERLLLIMNLQALGARGIETCLNAANEIERLSQRWEECEAVLREVARAPNRIAENARIIADYFGEGN